MNLLVQAVSLGVRYDSQLLDPDVSSEYQAVGVPNARAALTIYRM